MLQFFARFEVDELTGVAITEQESLKTYALRLSSHSLTNVL